jgi:hypothetical protein
MKRNSFVEKVGNFDILLDAALPLLNIGVDVRVQYRIKCMMRKMCRSPTLCRYWKIIIVCI